MLTKFTSMFPSVIAWLAAVLFLLGVVCPHPSFARNKTGLGKAGGAALGAVGVVGDGDCLVTPTLPGAMCPEVYNTAVSGAAGIAIGGALAITGTVLLALPSPRKQLTAAAAPRAMARLRFALGSASP